MVRRRLHSRPWGRLLGCGLEKSITAEGWVVEMRIPIAALRHEANMGLNFLEKDATA
jgi:hypothetical protein